MQACTLQLAVTVSCSAPKPVSMAALFIWRSTASLLHLCKMAFPSSCPVRRAKAAPSLFTSLSARCASRQGNQKGLARRKFLGPHSPPLPPSSCCQTHIVGQTQGRWQFLTNLPLAVTFASLPLDHWTSEGPIFMPVGGHCQLGGTFPLFLGPRPAATDLSKRVSLKAIVAADFLTP